jgi:hypothetical protein
VTLSVCVDLSPPELGDLLNRTLSAAIDITKAKTDQIEVTEKLCPGQLAVGERRLLAIGVIGLRITMKISDEVEAVKPADIALTADDFQVIGTVMIAVIYNAEAVNILPTITISVPVVTQVP